MKDIELRALDVVDEAKVSEAMVSNARTRPNASGLYGSQALTPEKVKEIFDKYPNLLKNKLNEVISFANALLGILEGDVSTDLIFLQERVGEDDLTEDSRFKEDVLASAILTLSGDLKREEQATDEHRERIENAEEGLSNISIAYDDVNEVITFTDSKGNKKVIDLPLESLVASAYLDGDNLVLVLENGTKVNVSTEAIAASISKVAGSVIPADGTHIYGEGSYIVFKDASGKTVRVRSFNADSYFGDIEEALDAILEIQNSLIFNQILDDIIEEQGEVLEAQDNLIGGETE